MSWRWPGEQAAKGSRGGTTDGDGDGAGSVVATGGAPDRVTVVDVPSVVVVGATGSPGAPRG